MVFLGDPQSARTGHRRGAHRQAPPGRHPALVRQQDRQRPDRGHQQPGAGRQSKGTRLSINSKPQGHGLPAGRQARPAAARVSTFLPIPNSEEPAKTSPGPWDAFADIDAFVDEVLAELEAMAKDGARPMRSGPKPPLAGAALRKAVM